MFKTSNRIRLTYIKEGILHFEEYYYKNLKTRVTKRSRNIDKTCFKFVWNPLDKVIYLVGISENGEKKESAFMEIGIKEMEILKRFLQVCLFAGKR